MILTPVLAGDVLGEILVRDHDDGVGAEFAGDIFHHRHRIADEVQQISLSAFTSAEVFT